jgi:hypothetical protein
MSTCKDCIHYEPCRDTYYNDKEQTRIPYNFLEKEGAEKNCAFFKDRSKFVELPCKVGDILYHPVPLRNIIAEYRIKSFQIYSNCVWVNWDLVDGVATINLSGIYANEIGKTVFLTQEEAEKALKECDNENS